VHLPSKDNEAIQPVPFIRQVSTVANNTHGNAFHAHLQGEEYEDAVINHLESIKS